MGDVRGELSFWRKRVPLALPSEKAAFWRRGTAYGDVHACMGRRRCVKSTLCANLRFQGEAAFGRRGTAYGDVHACMGRRRCGKSRLCANLRFRGKPYRERRKLCACAAGAKKPGLSTGLKIFWIFNYSMMSTTTPEPTVRPPSRIAKRRPFSIAMGVISVHSMSMWSPGMTISTPSGSLMLPVTSVVRK